MPKRSKCLSVTECEGIIQVWLVLLHFFLVMVILVEVTQISGYQWRIVHEMCSTNLPSRHLYPKYVFLISSQEHEPFMALLDTTRSLFRTQLNI